MNRQDIRARDQRTGVGRNVDRLELGNHQSTRGRRRIPGRRGRRIFPSHFGAI